ncbi:MAG: hypothetical protein KBB11_05915 [Bacteroidales bacterium]|nr:hypothetical protein [Bacteroidales bacterium]HOY37912.1 hypothetical protein [Bacteroidales bacterium]HQP03500.1 hypothetical protein [Bacteroidales bacterium]
MKRGYKDILWFVLLLILSSSLIIDGSGLFKFNFKVLEGFTSKHSLPAFSAKTWIDESFQDSLSTYIDNNFKLRPPMLRAYNEYKYRVFRKTNAAEVVLGKNNQCLQTGYILEHTGDYFVGNNLIEERCKRIKYLQDTFQQIGITMFVVFAPGKASFMPENIPDRYLRSKYDENNYTCFVKNCDKYNIRTLDLQQYFDEIKDTVSYPLFPTNGIHWSEYGMYLALDTFLNYTAKISSKKIPELTISGLKKTNKPQGEDYDVGKIMNLMLPLPEKTLAYPQFSKSDTTRPELDILIVGDSFMFHWLKYKLGEYLFRHYNLWYYNVMVYPEFYQKELYNYSVNIKEELLKRDVIVLECTETFMHTAFWNFEDMAFKLFNPDYTPDAVFYYQNDITKDRKQFISIFEKAKKSKRRLNDVLYEEAVYRAKTMPLGSVEYYVYSIKNSEQWLDLMKKQAREQGKHLDEIIMANAKWMTENDDYE